MRRMGLPARWIGVFGTDQHNSTAHDWQNYQRDKQSWGFSKPFATVENIAKIGWFRNPTDAEANAEANTCNR